MRHKIIIMVLILATGCKLSGSSDIPNVDLLLLDSTTKINTADITKGKPVILLFFSPNCEHCQLETDSILKNMNVFGKTNLYLFTVEPFDSLKLFNKVYELDKYQNVIVGRDYKFAFPKFIGKMDFPFLILYDKNLRQKAVFAGAADMKELITLTKSL